ncbi:hypothetical protein HK102_013325 [Quaeritorhiza haematococci]|nr:hypothetical protein HK102_013325 [Quaeritorhiza haematococci]
MNFARRRRYGPKPSTTSPPSTTTIDNAQQPQQERQVPTRKPSVQLRKTKGCFERVMSDPKLFAQLKKFAGEKNDIENVLFYQGLMTLESELADAVPDYNLPSCGTHALARFVATTEPTLHATATTSTTSSSTSSSFSDCSDYSDEHPSSPETSSIPVPSALRKSYVFVFDFFIADTAPVQLNLPNKLKRDVERQIRSSESFDSTVYDAIAAEVLQMIYYNTFTDWIKAVRRASRRRSGKVVAPASTAAPRTRASPSNAATNPNHGLERDSKPHGMARNDVETTAVSIEITTAPASQDDSSSNFSKGGKRDRLAPGWSTVPINGRVSSLSCGRDRKVEEADEASERRTIADDAVSVKSVDSGYSSVSIQAPPVPVRKAGASIPIPDVE